MKILYLAHYQERSSWATSAINNVKALSSIGIDVVCRNIRLNNSNDQIPSDILNFEKKDLENIDYCIQHILPSYIVGTKKFKKNIAYCPIKTKIDRNHSWLNNFKLVDELWVPSSDTKNALQEIHVESKNIPYAFNIQDYRKPRKLINLGIGNSKFKFYCISEFENKKNIIGLLRAYLSEFKSTEPVCLVLKLKSPTVEKNKFNQQVYSYIDAVKTELRIYKKLEYYPQIIVITEDMDDNLINDLHYSCNCYVNLSHANAWSSSSFDAMCYGNTPICSKQGGPVDFIDSSDQSTGSLIDGVYSVCHNKNSALPNIFTGKEEWFIPSESLAKKRMRWYFENNDQINKESGIVKADKFNYNNVANKIKEALDE